VGLERGPLSLVRIIEELLEWKSLGNRKLTAGGIRCADHATPSIRKKLALTSPTSGGRSVGIVRLRTKGHGVFLLCTSCIYVGIIMNKIISHKSRLKYRFIYIQSVSLGLATRNRMRSGSGRVHSLSNKKALLAVRHPPPHNAAATTTAPFLDYNFHFSYAAQRPSVKTRPVHCNLLITIAYILRQDNLYGYYQSSTLT
jgi:hypothetical protein